MRLLLALGLALVVAPLTSLHAQGPVRREARQLHREQRDLRQTTIERRGDVRQLARQSSQLTVAKRDRQRAIASQNPVAISAANRRVLRERRDVTVARREVKRDSRELRRDRRDVRMERRDVPRAGFRRRR